MSLDYNLKTTIANILACPQDYACLAAAVHDSERRYFLTRLLNDVNHALSQNIGGPLELARRAELLQLRGRIQQDLARLARPKVLTSI